MCASQDKRAIYCTCIHMCASQDSCGFNPSAAQNLTHSSSPESWNCAVLYIILYDTMGGGGGGGDLCFSCFLFRFLTAKAELLPPEFGHTL